MSANTQKNNFALVPKTPAAVEKAEPGTKRVLSGMVAETLALVKAGPLQKMAAPRIVLFDDNCEFWMLPANIAVLIKDLNKEANLTLAGATETWQQLSQTDPDLLIVITGATTPSDDCKTIFQTLRNRRAAYPIAVMSSCDMTETWVQELSGQGLKLSFQRMHLFEEKLRELFGTYSRTPRIVMVNDEHSILEIWESRIRSAISDVTILAFDDGEEAWQELLRTDPDLLITDIVRPTPMDGPKMLSLLAERRVKYPIVVMSGCDITKSERTFEAMASNLSIAIFGIDGAAFDTKEFRQFLVANLKA